MESGGWGELTSRQHFMFTDWIMGSAVYPDSSSSIFACYSTLLHGSTLLYSMYCTYILQTQEIRNQSSHLEYRHEPLHSDAFLYRPKTVLHLCILQRIGRYKYTALGAETLEHCLIFLLSVE